MSGTYTSESAGDWGNAAIWNIGSVPDSATADVIVDTAVTIAAGESFTAGTLAVGAAGLLQLAGNIDVAGPATLTGSASLSGGSLDTGGGLTLATAFTALDGNGTVAGSIDNAGLIAAADGLLDLAGPISGSGGLAIDLATGNSATLELGQASGAPVAFFGLDPLSPVSGVLKLDAPGAYTGTISGFSFGEAIDLAGIPAGSLTDSFSGNAQVGTLTVTNGTSAVASLTLAGNFTNFSFTLVPDGGTGTDVELVPPASETAIRGGDWGNAANWSGALVPDNRVTDVTITEFASIAISVAESFVANNVDVAGTFEAVAGLDVAGTLNAAGVLTIGPAGNLELTGTAAFVSAASIDVMSGISGAGTLASSGTLTNDGEISPSLPGGSPVLVLTPAVYVQGLDGDLHAGFGTLVIAPTATAGFANLVDGTLSGGRYFVDGTLLLPAPVTALANSSVFLGALGGPGSIVLGDLEGGGQPIQDTLVMLGSGGQLGIQGYDYASANTLTLDGGSIDLADSTVDVADLILLAGSSELSGGGVVAGSIENDGQILATPGEPGIAGSGTLDLAGLVTGSGTLEVTAASTLELGGSTAQQVAFGGLAQAAVLELDKPSAFDGTISGFTAGLVAFSTVSTVYVSDSIDLPGFAPGTLGELFNGNTAGGVLEIVAPDGVVASLTFAGDYTQDSFTLAADGNGGTDIKLLAPGSGGVPCFVLGTGIATANGERPVEALRVGDRVVTASGDLRPIVWIGRRRLDCQAHPRPELVWPIRIRAGAFGDGKPQHDLLLSPGHSVFCGGVLIPVERLINGATVAQERRPSVDYVHVELDRHDILFAEGLPAESYLDDGNRAAFENGAAHVHLHPDFRPRTWTDACAPRCTEGAALVTARQRLHGRALVLGYRIETGAGLCVIADGASVLPAATVAIRGKLARAKGTLHRFLLPRQTRELCVRSDAGVPAWTDPASRDWRRLGARIGGVYVDGRVVPLGSRYLAAGFHAIERRGGERWRWTDGVARLILPDRARDGAPIVLDLFVRGVIRRWSAAAARAQLVA